MLEVIVGSIGALLLGLFAARRERQARNAGVKEMGALMAKLRDDCPEGSWAHEAYDFVIDDMKKVAGEF